MSRMRLQNWMQESVGRTILFVLSLLFSTHSAWSKDVSIKAGTMTISFQAEESFVPKNFRERLGSDWENFCEKFSSNFILGKGPQGRGIANKVNCLAIAFGKDTETPPAIEEGWLLSFGWKGSGFSLSLYYKSKGIKDIHLINKIEFPKQFTPDLLFSAQEASYYVVNRIYRRLPVAWNTVVAKTDLQWQLSPLDPRSLSVFMPARKVGLFALRFDADKKIFIPTLYAVAQTIAADDAKKQIDREGNEPLELRWVIEPKGNKARLWAQEIVNPVEREIEPSFVTMRENRNSGSLLEGYALESLKSAQTIVRIASPFPKGSTVVSQASKAELLVNIGKGPLEGLTFGFEYSPRLSQVDGEDTYSFTWSRTEFGWSFPLGEPQTIDSFATRFKLVPKIGLLSMDAYFPLNASQNYEFATVAAFKVQRQLDLGGEFSWELESLNYRLKLWGTAHISGYILSGSNPTKVSNQRGGGEITYDLYKTSGGTRFGVMAFGYLDVVTLQQDTTPELGLNLATSTTASGASFNVTYIGGGLSLTW